MKNSGGTGRGGTMTIRSVLILVLLCTRTVYAQDGPPSSAAGKTATAPAPKEPVPASGLAGEAPVIPALQGYCVVAYFAKGEAVRGDAKYAVMHDDEQYLFSSAEAKAAFEADPTKFLPQFGGTCTTALGGTYGNVIGGDPTAFDVRDGKLYLFSSERAKRAYLSRPDWFIERAFDRFTKPALAGRDPVAYQQRMKAMMGNREVRHTYAGRVFFFVNDAMREEFIDDPTRYLPQYEGYCAEGMARGKRYPADPAVFAVYDDKTYLFFDEEAQLKFMMSYPDFIRKADAAWALPRTAPVEETANRKGEDQ